MKKITVLKSNGELIHQGLYAGQEWLEQNLSTNAWGLPERWLPDFLEGVETREVTTGNSLISDEGLEYAEMQTEYLHPAEYTYEIVDLSKDHDYLLAECIAKRKAEYPSIEEIVVALIEDDKDVLRTLKDKRNAIKAKYPKPSKDVVEK
jgi:hypothetical protein